MPDDLREEFDKLNKAFKVEILREEELKMHTSFKVGGPADFFIRVFDIDGLKATIKLLKRNAVKYFILGNGSNLLVSDKGYRGAVIKLAGDFLKLKLRDNILISGAGLMLSALCRKALEEELTGLEFAYGIPGSVGGGIVMNAGAYGGELKDVVSEVTLLNSEGEIVKKTVEEMHFGYRSSILRQEDYVVLEASFLLNKGDKTLIKEKMDDLMGRRLAKQPLEFPSGGSTFKRPEGYFAGKLIEDAGLKGFSIGGAGVSKKHAGFVINYKEASASEINEVIKEVQKKVFETSGIKLETEIIKIGEF